MCKNETNIPLCKAKKIDSDEYVVGFLAYQESNNTYYIFKNNAIGLYRIEIDETALEVSFNSGVTWFSLECVNLIMNSNEIIGIQE